MAQIQNLFRSLKIKHKTLTLKFTKSSSKSKVTEADLATSEKTIIKLRTMQKRFILNDVSPTKSLLELNKNSNGIAAYMIAYICFLYSLNINKRFLLKNLS